MAQNQTVPLIKTKEQSDNLYQNQNNNAVNSITKMPMLNGNMLTAVLASGSNSIPTKIGRKPQGYFVTNIDAASTIHTISMDDKFLVLNSTAPCNVSLWVF